MTEEIEKKMRRRQMLGTGLFVLSFFFGVYILLGALTYNQPDGLIDQNGQMTVPVLEAIALFISILVAEWIVRRQLAKKQGSMTKLGLFWIGAFIGMFVLATTAMTVIGGLLPEKLVTVPFPAYVVFTVLWMIGTWYYRKRYVFSIPTK